MSLEKSVQRKVAKICDGCDECERKNYIKLKQDRKISNKMLKNL
jgi:hypothetical protein